MTKYKITGIFDYVQGHLRYGHKELEVEAEEWDSMTEDEQKDYLRKCGDFVLDDYELEDCGEIEEITKEEI